MYCYKCGAKNPDEAVYCMKCGTKLLNGGQTPSTTNTSNHHKQEDTIVQMSFIDEIKEMREHTVTKKYNAFTHNLLSAVRRACISSPNRRVAGYFYCKYADDVPGDYNTEYGLTSQANDESTHLESGFGGWHIKDIYETGHTEELRREIIETLKNKGLQVNAVNITKNSKYRSAPNGYGFFGQQKYKQILINYVQVYIDVQW